MAAMTLAFGASKFAMPDRKAVLSIVGLSLNEAFATLCPSASEMSRTHLVQAYKDAFNEIRGPDGKAELSPLFPGALDALDILRGQDHTLLAVATGKSRRGLDKMLERHGLSGVFQSEQVADHHPSKPNPSMILAALDETGVAPARAVMLGDTTYDMDMASAAGIKRIGVTWGYHAPEQLGADAKIETFAALSGAVDQLLGP